MIVINGKTYKGYNVTIKNNKVFIDGKVSKIDVDSCKNIKITGDSGNAIYRVFVLIVRKCLNVVYKWSKF